MNKTIFIVIATLLVVALSATALGAKKTWNRTNGGTWTTNASWTPTGAPVAGDDVIIPVNQTGNITAVPTITLDSLTINGNCFFAAGTSGNTMTITNIMLVAAGKTLTLGTTNARLNFTLNGTATINGNLAFDGGTAARYFTVNSGATLIINTGGRLYDPNLSAGSCFVLNSGATLEIAAPGGISTGTTANPNVAINFGGTYSYSTGANYEYIGTAAQVTGNGLPATVNNLTINNTVGVILSQATTVNGVLTLDNGWLDNSSPNTLTLGTGGSLVDAGGYLIAPLPVEMTSFTALIQGTSALLQWSTATETNNSGFQIERSAEGSDAWIKVVFVNGAGISNAPKYYSYEDKNLVPGAYIYRIKQIDNDGTVTIYNSIPKVDAGKSNALQLCDNYPNPFNPSTEIRFSVPQNGYVSLKVYNMIGQEIVTLFSGQATAGHYMIATFNASRLASGIYFARLQYNGKSLVHRMMLTK